MNGYIFDEYTDTSPGSYIDVLSCDIQHTGLPSVHQIYCQDNNTWSDVSGCNLIQKGLLQYDSRFKLSALFQVCCNQKEA